MGFFGTLFNGGASNFNPVIQGAQNLATTGTNQGNTLFGQSQGLYGQLAPFLSSEVSNPQGLGATTLSQMNTQAGQSTAGADAAAKQTALDNAARTGNTAAVPGAISSGNKAGMTALSNILNKNQIQNQMTKLQQQQEGASGLSGLFDKTLSGANSFEDLANKALGTEQTSLEAKNKAEQQGMSNIMGGIQGLGDMASSYIPGAAGGAAGNIGTLASLFTL